MLSPTRTARQMFTRTGIARVAVGACALLVAAPLASVPAASAAAPQGRAAAAFVDLGDAAGYSVLAGAGVSNTGTATVLALDLGLSPAGVIAGFPPGTVAGTIHDKDAAAEAAQEDRQAAYDAVLAQTGGTAFGGDQAGAIFKPGLHTSAAALTNTGTITLDADGDSGGVFVFQVGGALSSAAATKIVLTDGALANNVYWQVNGAVSLGAGAKVVGTFLATGAISFGEGSSLKGRALTPSTVALANTPVTRPIDDLTAPVVAIDGGPTSATNDTTPSISGTTDEAAGRPVTVTVAGQTLTTTVGADGHWSVGPAPLAEGEHQVVATITDASQNTGTASQVLTVDVTDPVVTVDGGPTRATNDQTPAISGTTDEPGDTTVTVTVGGQTLTTTAGVGGVWSVTAATLTESTHAVVATVDDAAGNAGTASQILTIDVTKPVVTIDGGATRTTKDTSPWTYGTSGEQAGTTVHLAIGGQDLTATVLGDGTWSVSATTLAEGRYHLVASITDAAGNTGTATQTLVVGDPPAPADRHQPDAAIRRGDGAFVGAGSYGGSADQRLTVQLRRTARTASFDVRLTNRGDVADTFVVRGTPRNRKFAVTYLAGGQNVTKAVVAGTYRTDNLRPGESALMIIRVRLLNPAKPDNRRVFELRAASTRAGANADTVAAVARR